MPRYSKPSIKRTARWGKLELTTAAVVGTTAAVVAVAVDMIALTNKLTGERRWDKGLLNVVTSTISSLRSFSLIVYACAYDD